MAPSIFSATLGVSPLAGSLLRLSALGSLAICVTRLSFARSIVGGLADQPLSAVTAPAKENKLSFYQNTSWFLIGAVLQLTWSFRGGRNYSQAFSRQSCEADPSFDRYSLGPWYVVLRKSFARDGIDVKIYLTDKAAFALLGLQLASGGIGEYKLAHTGLAFAFAGSLLPMLGALSD